MKLNILFVTKLLTPSKALVEGANIGKTFFSGARCMAYKRLETPAL